MIKYENITTEESQKVRQIARKAVGYNPELDLMHVSMDLTAVHCNLGGLRLDDMLETDMFNLLHDVYGIGDNLNRETIELEHFFVPRFSA